MRAKQSQYHKRRDCFVTSFLAMTVRLPRAFGAHNDFYSVIVNPDILHTIGKIIDCYINVKYCTICHELNTTLLTFYEHNIH